MTDALPLEPVDGRHRRRTRTRQAIVQACRGLMRAGYFRPMLEEVAYDASCSVWTVFQHFGSAEGLYVEAIDDQQTREIMLSLLPGLVVDPPQAIAIARAIVLGRAR